MLLRILRSLALGWTLAAAVVPAVVSVADARTEALASQVTPHVEQPGGSDACPVAHAADCIACTMLRTGQLPAGRPVLQPQAGRRVASPHADPVAWLAPHSGRLALSRAPPSA